MERSARSYLTLLEKGTLWDDRHIQAATVLSNLTANFRLRAIVWNPFPRL